MTRWACRFLTRRFIVFKFVVVLFVKMRLLIPVSLDNTGPSQFRRLRLDLTSFWRKSLVVRRLPVTVLRLWRQSRSLVRRPTWKRVFRHWLTF